MTFPSFRMLSLIFLLIRYLKSVRGSKQDGVVVNKFPDCSHTYFGQISACHSSGDVKNHSGYQSEIMSTRPTRCCCAEAGFGYFVARLRLILSKIVAFFSGYSTGCRKEALLDLPLKQSSLDYELLPNYRPISNLMCTSKLCERVIAAKLYNYQSSERE